MVRLVALISTFLKLHLLNGLAWHDSFSLRKRLWNLLRRFKSAVRRIYGGYLAFSHTPSLGLRLVGRFLVRDSSISVLKRKIRAKEVCGRPEVRFPGG